MAKREALKLNDTEIRQWVKNNVRFDARADGNGLYLRYRETDKKPVFFFRFKFAGIENKIIVGKFSDMSLTSARKKCVEFRSDLIKGLNPASERRETKRKEVAKAIADQSAHTVTELVVEYFQLKVEGKCKTAKAMRGRVNKYLIPVIGRMRIDDIEPMHITNMLDRIIKAGAPTTANDVLTYSKQIFNHAIKRHIIKHNPADAFDFTDAGGTESSRTRFLSQDEIIKLFKAMSESEKFTRHHYLCTKLLLMLGCRKAELFKAKRTDFDLTEAVWCMSLENKTKSAITIPLSSQAVAIIHELLQFQIDGSEYLLPAQGVRTSMSGYINDSYLNKPIKNWVFPLMADVPNFHIHDFRATMKSHMRQMGIDRFVSERCLNHKIPDMEGVYDRGDYFKEREAALEKWADFLESCEKSA